MIKKVMGSLMMLALAAALLVPTAAAVNLCPVVVVPIADTEGPGDDGSSAGGSGGAECVQEFELETGDNEQVAETGDGGEGGASGEGGAGGDGGDSGPAGAGGESGGAGAAGNSGGAGADSGGGLL